MFYRENVVALRPSVAGNIVERFAFSEQYFEYVARLEL